MTDVLITYASTHGHTAKICTALETEMVSEGLTVDLKNVRTDPARNPGEYGGIVVAASIHKDEHQKEMVEWVDAHMVELVSRPNAFISVSLTAAEDSEEAREATRVCVEHFVRETGWRPKRTETVAGALQYREYDPFTRIMMRLLMKRGGHPTDTSHDHDFTDWDAVKRLGRELAAGFDAPVVAT